MRPGRRYDTHFGPSDAKRFFRSDLLTRSHELDAKLDMSATNVDLEATSELRRWLETAPAIFGEGWLGQLEPRKQEEAHFHDHDRDDFHDETPESTPNRRFYEAAGLVTDYMDQRLRTLAPGSTFLDYACGNGKTTLKVAEAGAALTVGIDISEISIRNCIVKARRRRLDDRVFFLQRDCENTQLPTGSFSLCLCSGMLHHLDLHRAYPELHRIMAPGGRILCFEALAYNPVIQWYRNRTPDLRTSWEKEHILSLRDVQLARRWFAVQNIRYFLMAAPVATLLPAGPLRRAGLRVGHMIDRVVTRMPFLNRWSWMFAFELVKRAN